MYGSVNEYDIQHDPPFAFHVVFPERKKKVRYYDFNNLDHKGDKKTMDVHLLQFIIWLFIIGFGMLVLSQLFFYKTNFNLSSYTGAEEGPGCMQHNCATLIQGATTSEKGSKGLGVSNCMNYFDLQKTEQCLDQSKSVFAAKIKLCGVCNNCFTSDGPKPEECKDLPSMKPGGSWWPNPPKTKSEVDNALRGKTTDSPAKTGPTKDSTPSSPVIQPNVPATTETPTAPVGGAYDSMFKNLTSKIFGDVGKLMDAGTEKYTTNNSPAAVSSTANIYMKQNSKPSFSDSVAKPAFDDSVSKPSFADSVSDFLGKQKAAFSGKEVVRDTKTTDPTKSNSFNWKKYLGGGTTAGGGKDDVDYAGKYKGYADKYKEYVPSDYSNSFNVKSQATDVTPSEINFNAEPQITAVDKSSLLTAVFGKKIIASPETLTKLASNPNWDELIGGKNKKYAEEKEKSLKKYSDQYKGYAKDFGFDFNVAEAAVNDRPSLLRTLIAEHITAPVFKSTLKTTAANLSYASQHTTNMLLGEFPLTFPNVAEAAKSIWQEVADSQQNDFAKNKLLWNLVKFQNELRYGSIEGNRRQLSRTWEKGHGTKFNSHIKKGYWAAIRNTMDLKFMNLENQQLTIPTGVIKKLQKIFPDENLEDILRYDNFEQLMEKVYPDKSKEIGDCFRFMVADESEHDPIVHSLRNLILVIYLFFI